MPNINALVTIERKGALGGVHGFLLGESKRWILLNEVHDFVLIGLTAIPRRDIKRIRRSGMDKVHEQIHELQKALPRAEPDVPFDDAQELLAHLKGKREMAIVECEGDSEWAFSIGKVEEVSSSKVSIHNFDPEGRFDKKPRSIELPEITRIRFRDRYIRGYLSYFKWKKRNHPSH